MIAPPTTAEEIERDRAQVSAGMQEIYDEAERGVDAEVERIDRARVWALQEMDRITAKAVKAIRDREDPDEVERRLQEELAATIATASAPTFDPRRLLPPTVPAAPTPTTAPSPPPPVASPIVPEVVVVPPPPPLPAPSAATDPPAGCGCRSSSRDGSALAVLGLAIALFARPRLRNR